MDDLLQDAHGCVCSTFTSVKHMNILEQQKHGEYTQKTKASAKHDHYWNLLLSTLAFWSHIWTSNVCHKCLKPTADLISIINQLTPRNNWLLKYL